MKFSLRNLETNPALLIYRIGLGATMAIHGYPKVTNPAKWEFLGSQMQHIGIDFAPTFWGMMAAFTEFGGGLALILGLATRLSSSLLAFTMVVATLFHINKGDDFGTTSHSLELAIVYAGLALLGGGAYSLDALIKRISFKRLVPLAAGLILSISAQAKTIDLVGENLHPEGITYRASTNSYYVGSAANGSVQKVQDGKAQLIQAAGTDGRIKTLGLNIDETRKRLWLVDGAAVYVYNIDSNQLIAKIPVSSVADVKTSALNDLTLDQQGNAYITDSFNPFILKVDGASLQMTIFQDVSAANFGQQNDFTYNFNGIVLSPDQKSLIVVKTNDGTLWNLELGSKKLTQIHLSEAVTKGDGLALDQNRNLYIIRNFENKISKIKLDKKSVTKIYQVENVTVDHLDIPTTATFDGKNLVIVNSQFGKSEVSHPFKLTVKKLN